MNLNLLKHTASGAYIHTPLVNVSELIGRDVSFHCAVSGVQESWEFMQWVKVSLIIKYMYIILN